MHRGDLFQSGHQSLARTLASNYDITVESKGDAFYNESNFTHLFFMEALFNYLKDYDVQNRKDLDVHEICDQAEENMRQEDSPNRIVIASTPDWIDDHMRHVLDGGLMHEVFHSLFSDQSHQMDRNRMRHIMDYHFDPEVDYVRKKSILKTANGAFEDAMIERQGINRFKGALQKLQSLHRYVWNQEDVDDMNPSDQILMGIRDALKEDYLNMDPPMHRYDQSIQSLLEKHFDDLIKKGRQAEDSYHTLALGLETLNRMDQLIDLEENLSQEPSDGRDSDEEDNKGSDKGEEKRTPESPSQDIESEDDMDMDMDPVQRAEIAKEISQAQETEIEDPSDLMNSWDPVSQQDHIPPTVRPYSREEDTYKDIKDPTHEQIQSYQETRSRIQKMTAHLRPKLMALLRGEEKTRHRHRVREGDRLSSRSIAEVTYKDRPRPFKRMEKTERTDACCSLLIDQSSSMGGRRIKQAGRVGALLTSTLGALQIPHEIVGFTNQDDYLTHDLDSSSFTRICPVTYHFFRRFDDPFTTRQAARLMDLKAHHMTPLPDAIHDAGRRLVPREEERKLLIVLTDGKPHYGNFSSYGSGDFLDIMDHQMEALQSQNIHPLFLGMASKTHKLSYIERYDHACQVADETTMAATLADFLYEQISRMP